MTDSIFKRFLLTTEKLGPRIYLFDTRFDSIEDAVEQVQLFSKYPTEFRNFRLYEYTSEHGYREIPIPEVES